MKKENTVVYHVWTNKEPIMADVFSTTILKDGCQIHGKVGQLEIKEGDAVYLNYGSSNMVYTRSGKGYESEYPHGRITLHGTPIAIELTENQSVFVKRAESTKVEFEAKVETQSNRVKPLINDLITKFAEAETLRREAAKEGAKKSEEYRKQIILNALTEMEKVFGNRSENQAIKKVDNNQKNKPKF